MRCLAYMLLLLVSMTSIASANPKLGCLPVPASAEIAWLFNGVAYPTLECAEGAMRAVPGNEDMEPVDENIVTEPGVVLRYHIKPNRLLKN